MLLRQDFAICFCLISAIVTGASQASNVVVPDDVPTVQLALDSFADTVLVKSGVGLESPTIRRGVVLRGAEANVTLPELASLLLDLTGESYTGAVRIEGLHVMGQVRVQTSEQWVSLLSFTQCQLDSGLIHNYSQDEVLRSVIVNDCVIGYVFSVRVPDLFDFRNNTVHGSIATGAVKMGTAIVRDNDFENRCAGCSTGLRIGDYSTSEVSDNVFSGYEQGAYLSGLEFWVTGNRAENCHDTGFLLAMDVAHVSRNEIKRCGVGLDVYSYRCEIVGNHVLGSSKRGIQITAVSEGVIRDNVVGRSGEAGLTIAFGGYPSLRVSNNTSYLNGGSGLIVTGAFPDFVDSVVTHNVGYGNERYGVEWAVTNTGPLTCNDWYGNGLGAMLGTAVGAQDRTVDPEFCNLNEDDVHLKATSPLLDASGCGLVGALGLGCDVPTEVVALLEARVLSDAIEVRWRLSVEAEAQDVWLERGDSETEPWLRIPTKRRQEDDFVVERDNRVEPGSTYRYRLCWMSSAGDIRSSVSIVVTIAARPRAFRLGPLVPNPSSGPTRIDFSLPRRGRVGLALFDALGRKVVQLAEGLYEPGDYDVRWSGSANGALAPTGLYFVTYRTPEGAQTMRLLLVR